MKAYINELLIGEDDNGVIAGAAHPKQSHYYDFASRQKLNVATRIIEVLTDAAAYVVLGDVAAADFDQGTNPIGVAFYVPANTPRYISVAPRRAVQTDTNAGWDITIFASTN